MSGAYVFKEKKRVIAAVSAGRAIKRYPYCKSMKCHRYSGKENAMKMFAIMLERMITPS